MKKVLKTIFQKLTTQKSDFGLTNENRRKLWIEKTLKSLESGLKILDAGAGEQQYKQFCTHLQYLSQDIAEYDASLEVGLQMKKWDFGKLDIISDIVNIPQDDQSFDVILCTEVIEHIPDPVRVFPEFKRLLKSGGQLILTAPFCSLTHFAPYHYATGFSRFFYEKHLKDNGFEIIEMNFNGNYFEYLAQELYTLSDIAKDYSNTKFGLKTKMAIKLIQKKLEQLSNRDKNSNELLCFGIHIHAIKK